MTPYERAALAELRAWQAEPPSWGTRLLARRDPQWRELLRLARGQRLYAIWSAKDPLPGLVYFAAHFLPGVLRAAAHMLRSAITRRKAIPVVPKEALSYENRIRG